MFKRDISTHLKDLYQKELQIRKTLSEIVAEISILNSTVLDADDFNAHSEKLLALDKRREMAEAAINIINTKRINLLKQQHEEVLAQHSKNVSKLSREAAQAEKLWQEAQQKADELKAKYRNANIKYKTAAASTPIAFWDKPWSLKSLRDKVESPDCPIRDRAELVACIERYDDAEKQGRNYPFPHIFINEDGAIVNFEGDPQGSKGV